VIMTISEQSNPTDLERRDAMMTERTSGLVFVAAMKRRAAWMALLAATLFVFGCGSDSQHSSSAAKYPTGISEDIGQQLKYDARVDSFDAEGEDLIVNVNDTWLHSPPGMRERALGQWYSLWQPGHSAASKIVVKRDGNEVESWTAGKGYQPVSKEKKNATEG
jgi:hypothetical protein